MCSVDVPPPWLARVAHIKAAAQFNVDTERKVVRLSEELKDMLREIKLRVSAAVGIGDWFQVNRWRGESLPDNYAGSELAGERSEGGDA